VHVSDWPLQHARVPLTLGSQSNVPQHWSDDVQVMSPTGRHIGIVWQLPATHVRPVQQSGVPMHDMPVLMHPVGAVHVPPMQSSAPQQSMLFSHVSPELRHTHDPPVQSIEPQQSALDVHVSDGPAQQLIEPTTRSHRSAPQQSPDRMQLDPVGRHVGVVHVPALHMSPVLHMPPLQHAAPEVPHIVDAMHVPPEQLSPA
jgi:hypothetical protein